MSDDKQKRTLDEEGLPVLFITEKDWVLENFDKKTHKELTQHIANDPAVDGRHNLGKAIKKFLALDGKTAKSAAFVAAGPIELTDEQKDFVKTNLEKIPKTLEMTRLMFGNEKLASLSREFTAVHNYKKELAPDDSDITDEMVEEKTYKPPYNISQIIGKVNDHVPSAGGAKNPYDYNNLKPNEERNLRALIGYMKIPRFIYQATSFSKKVDREIFEGEFVRCCLDKPDLEPEELSQYISHAASVVSQAQAVRILMELEKKFEEDLKSGSDSKMINQKMSETINAYRARVAEESKQQKELLGKLTKSRSDRLSNRIEGLHIVNIFNAWLDEETRVDLLSLGDLEKSEDAAEVKRLNSMERVIALIAGQTEEEASN